MDIVTTINGTNKIEIVYREKYDNGKKARAKKANFISYLLATYCVINLRGIPEEKKKHYPYETRAPSKLINRCGFLEK